MTGSAQSASFVSNTRDSLDQGALTASESVVAVYAAAAAGVCAIMYAVQRAWRALHSVLCSMDTTDRLRAATQFVGNGVFALAWHARAARLYRVHACTPQLH